MGWWVGGWVGEKEDRWEEVSRWKGRRDGGMEREREEGRKGR